LLDRYTSARCRSEAAAGNNKRESMTEARKTDRRHGINKIAIERRVPKPDEDDFIDKWHEDIEFCALTQFEARMAQQYMDWQPFTQWMEARQDD
jgi:hypothetical protein